jgi:hypothetical protein
MANTPSPVWVYNETIKIFPRPASPPFEDSDDLETHRGRAWGINEKAYYISEPAAPRISSAAEVKIFKDWLLN